MLVVGTKWLDEGDRGKLTILQVQEEIVFVLQMRGRHRVALTVFPRSVVVVEGKRLMMPLEQWIHRRVRRSRPIVCGIGGRTRQRVIPSAGVPLPTYVFGAQPIADCRNVGSSRIARITVVLRGEESGAVRVRSGGSQ